MRGKVLFAFPAFLRFGITPAYAGKRAFAWRWSNPAWDPPRLCGEKSTTDKPPRHCRGSPPPMRGKENLSDELKDFQGITPAYAGKRPSHREGTLAHKDHPRLCGEKPESNSGYICISGSPPPMRGKDLIADMDDPRYRITPAYAGKSSRLPFIPTSFQDHPRLCGEKML